jgi:exopolysaccharide biosynthesis polyprenyl glycosylphosphotransferase
MKNNASVFYAFCLIIADFVALGTAFVLAYVFRVRFDSRALVNQIAFMTYFKSLLVLIPLWQIIYSLLGLYRQDVYQKFFNEVSKLIVGSAIGTMLIITIDYASPKQLFPARLVPVYIATLSFAVVFLSRSILRFLKTLAFRADLFVNRIMIIGGGKNTPELIRALHPTHLTGYKVVALCTKKDLRVDTGITHYDTLDQALANLDNIDIIIQTALFTQNSINQHIIDTANNKHISYKFVPTQSTWYSNNNRIELFRNFPVVAVHRTPLIGWGRLAKRLFDIVGSLTALLLASPFMLVIAIVIKLTDPKGKVFYKHKRVTRFGNYFYAYKLRSMYNCYCSGKKNDIEIFTEMGREDLVDEWNKYQKIAKDPRVMPIGKFTRKTGLDELPQLWNVLRGELSLIGPRPVTKPELERYNNTSSLFLSIKPGITGLWQVSGRSGTSADFADRIALDLYYVKNWSFLLDLKIVYWTILYMLKGKGQ